MRRKKREEEHENHERWLVSYADFITLLFAFFVVMYAISSVNDGKYRVLSTTLVDAFQAGRQGSMEPIQIGDEVRSPVPVTEEPFVGSMATSSDLIEIEEAEESAVTVVDGTAKKPTDEALEFPLEPIAKDIKDSLSPFIEQELVDVNQNRYWIEVGIKSKMLFTSGSARIESSALKALRDIASIIKPLPNMIHVEGHTDNVPIKTVAFPSNWELSAARAASVVHLFTRLGMEPNRLAAIGYGEHRPIADNTSSQGRQKNRRVSLVIMAQQKRQGDRDFPIMPTGDAP